MLHFKNKDGVVFAYESQDDRDKFGATDLVQITQSELDAYIAALNPLQWPRFVGNEKLDLFTQPEQLAVVAATMQDPVVKLLYDRLLNAAYLSYEDPETEQGLSVLVAKGLLTAVRKAEIVAAMQPQGAAE